MRKGRGAGTAAGRRRVRARESPGRAGRKATAARTPRSRVRGRTRGAPRGKPTCAGGAPVTRGRGTGGAWGGGGVRPVAELVGDARERVEDLAGVHPLAGCASRENG